MDTIATGDIRQNLKEIEASISEAVKVAISKKDHTSMAIAGVLLGLQSTINGGGLMDWVEFSRRFAEKMLPIWTAQVEAQNN